MDSDSALRPARYSAGDELDLHQSTFLGTRQEADGRVAEQHESRYVEPMRTYHLAQLNIGRILAPLDSPQLAGFMARLDEINALAEAAPGFVWRFQTEDGNATALRPYEDDRILVNFSVWTSAEALHAFVYRTVHVEVMRQRR